MRMVSALRVMLAQIVACLFMGWLHLGLDGAWMGLTIFFGSAIASTTILFGTGLVGPEEF